MRAGYFVGIGFFITLALAACQTWLPLWSLLHGPRLRECPGALFPTQEIPDGFRLHQRIRIRAEKVSVGLETVAQKHGDEFVLIGLNSMGAKVFAVRQRGLEIEVKEFMGRAFPVPPRNVLYDLHRELFFRVPREPVQDGDFRSLAGGVEITEEWRKGRPRRRVFHRPGEAEADAVVLEFAADTPPGTTASVHLRNPVCGYEAAIVTLLETVPERK